MKLPLPVSSEFVQLRRLKLNYFCQTSPEVANRSILTFDSCDSTFRDPDHLVYSLRKALFQLQTICC